MSELIKYKNYLDSELNLIADQIKEYNRLIQSRLDQNKADNEQIQILIIERKVHEKNLTKFNKLISPEAISINEAKESTNKTKESTTISTVKLEIDDIFIEHFDYPKQDAILYKSIKIYIANSNKVAVTYIGGTGIYYTTIERALKIPYPTKVSQVFGLTWNNNNKTAMKQLREYLSRTKYDKDRIFYPSEINDTNINPDEGKIDEI